MALPSTVNPLRYIIQRQYKDNIIKNKLFSERFAKAKNLYRKDLLAHYGCVNAIEFSEDGEFLISGEIYSHLFINNYTGFLSINSVRLLLIIFC